MTKIEIKKVREGEFQVRVIEGNGESSHLVTVTPEDYQRLANGNAEMSELVKRSFEFLLEHEAKESILSRFDLMVIGHYFPNYEREMKRRLSGAPNAARQEQNSC